MVDLTADLQMYIDLTQGVSDLSGNGNDATRQNGQTGTLFVKSSNQYLSITTPNLPSGDATRTIFCEVDHNTINSNQIYLSYGTTGAKTIFSAFLRNNNLLALVDDLTLFSSTGTLTNNTQYKLVFVYDSVASTIKIYIDGVLSSTTLAVPYAFLTTNAAAEIGKQIDITTQNQMDGDIFNIGVSNKAWDSADIAEYQSNGIVFPSDEVSNTFFFVGGI